MTVTTDDPAAPLEAYLVATERLYGEPQADTYPAAIVYDLDGRTELLLGDLRRAVAAIRSAASGRLHAEAALAAARETNAALVAEVERLRYVADYGARAFGGSVLEAMHLRTEVERLKAERATPPDDLPCRASFPRERSS